MAESYTTPHSLPVLGTADYVRSPTGDNIRKQINALATTTNLAITNEGIRAEGAAKTYADTKDTSNRSAWAAADTTTLNSAKAYADAGLAADRARLTTLESATLIYGNGYVNPPVSYTTDANTKGLWKFEDTLTDSSGNGHTLTQVSTFVGNYSTDYKFGAKSLGSGVFQNAAADTFLSSTGTTGGTFTTGTVEGWIRTIPHTGIKVFLSHRNWFWIGMAANGTPIAKYGQGANEKTVTGTTVLSGATFAAAPWHHVALVFDGAAGVRLYVDGKLEGSNAAVETVGTTTGFTVGGLQAAPTFNWDLSTARVDEVRLSNVARYAATLSYPPRPSGLKPGGALFIGPVLPPERQPYDQWIQMETA